jgi:spermidine/putrescine transport system substrate-binding protein
VDLGGSTSLSVLNWPLYIDPDEDGALGSISRMREELGLQVRYDDSYEDNIAAWNDLIVPALGSGNQLGYDIITPTYWLAGRMVERGWAEQVPLEIVPNHVNIDPAYLTQEWDRGARFHMPWQAGITGIAYDPARTQRELTSIADLFDPAFAGRIGIIGEMRETVPFGMLLNGDDPSRPTEATASAGLKLFEEARRSGQIAQVTFGEFADGLASGDLWAAMAWSGDTVLLQADRPDITFVVPEEGAVRWFDTMVIPKGSANVAAAGAWMNFVYDPVNAAQITAWVQYISPVIGVAEALQDLGGDAAELARNPILFPDDATKRRLFTWGGLPIEVEDQLDARFGALF